MQTSPTSSPISIRSCADRRRSAVAAWATLTSLILWSPASALANGRFPSARFLTFAPGAASPRIGLQTTFGYVFSTDAGKTWQLRCEEAIGFESTAVWDPPLVLTESRAIAGLPFGLSVAGTNYCGFDRAASVPDDPVVDLASDPSGQRVAAAMGPLFKPNGLMLSDDGGVSWRAGWSLDDFLILTIDIAPSRPQRLYASGLLANKATLFRSDDGGATFVPAARDFEQGAYIYIAAVDPQNPDAVYLRVDLQGATALSRSDDGGATFRELKRTRSRMTGFALSNDGRSVWIGSPGYLPDDGIFLSTDGGATWAAKSEGHTVLCLRHHDGILYMCTPPEMNSGIALACSGDDGETFSPLLTFTDLTGPESCPAGSPGRDLCDPEWPALRARLIPDGGAPPLGPRGCTRAPARDAGVPDAPAADAPVADAPTAPAAGADAAGNADARPSIAPPAGDGGCSCTFTGSASTYAPAAIVGLLAFLLRRRRRPSRRS
jgi:MYXO-CTERM domain-containing protein